jgi:putative tryptophan/tyrosine transport system substrate-binding protein
VRAAGGESRVPRLPQNSPPPSPPSPSTGEGRDITRRAVTILLGGAAAAWPLAAGAQQPERTYRIALLAPFDPLQDVGGYKFERGGLVEGRNLFFDRRGIGVEIARFEAVAADLVKAGPDAIMAWGPAAALAAQHATRSIPIVFTADDPIESQLVASMSQPGGNMTGVGIFAAQLDAKRLEILHELVPTARRIGVLADPTQAGRAQVEAMGQALGLELVTREARRAEEIVAALDALAAEHVAAINILASALFFGERALIIERTRALRLPAIYWWSELAREGGLVGFGPGFEEQQRLMGQQLLRVLKGAAPADLPIVQPTRFELIINLKTAAALGLTVPQALLARADEVIE